MTWGEGYHSGQDGMLKAIETAELLATIRERDRIIDLIEGLFAKSVVPGYQTAVADAVALIKAGKDE
jgi:hypothetical protein